MRCDRPSWRTNSQLHSLCKLRRLTDEEDHAIVSAPEQVLVVLTAYQEPRMARILVVEDEPIARRLVIRILQRAGHELRGAATVDEAVGACAEFSPQIAVLDWLL